MIASRWTSLCSRCPPTRSTPRSRPPSPARSRRSLSRRTRSPPWAPTWRSSATVWLRPRLQRPRASLPRLRQLPQQRPSLSRPRRRRWPRSPSRLPRSRQRRQQRQRLLPPSLVASRSRCRLLASRSPRARSPVGSRLWATRSRSTSRSLRCPPTRSTPRSPRHSPACSQRSLSTRTRLPPWARRWPPSGARPKSPHPPPRSPTRLPHLPRLPLPLLPPRRLRLPLPRPLRLRPPLLPPRTRRQPRQAVTASTPHRWCAS